MPVRMSTALRRGGRLLTLLACAAVPALGLASREVPVFTVPVAAETPAALQQAMQAVLVRATGHASAATDPQLAPLVANAAQYVQGYEHGGQGEPLVDFNASALEQAISAAGRNVWNADRPFTLIVLSPPPGASQQAADAAAVQQAAEARGMPISIVPLAVREPNGRLLPSAKLLAMVHNLGAEQLLIGRDLTAASSLALPAPAPAAGMTMGGASDGAASAGAVPMPSDTWHWTLVTPFVTREFTGSITTGIDATVDLLAPPLEASPADRIARTPVRIEGLRTLDQYARVETMLAAVPGVRHSTVERIAGTTAVFDLWARGGASAVRRMLAISPRFKPLSANGMLAYEYVPAPPPASTPTARDAASAGQTDAPAVAASPPAPPL
jgi:hypothetical protein